MAPTIWPHLILADLLTGEGDEMPGDVLHLTHLSPAPVMRMPLPVTPSPPSAAAF